METKNEKVTPKTTKLTRVRKEKVVKRSDENKLTIDVSNLTGEEYKFLLKLMVKQLKSKK